MGPGWGGGYYPHSSWLISCSAARVRLLCGFSAVALTCKSSRIRCHYLSIISVHVSSGSYCPRVREQRGAINLSSITGGVNHSFVRVCAVAPRTLHLSCTWRVGTFITGAGYTVALRMTFVAVTSVRASHHHLQICRIFFCSLVQVIDPLLPRYGSSCRPGSSYILGMNRRAQAEQGMYQETRLNRA